MYEEEKRRTNALLFRFFSKLLELEIDDSAGLAFGVCRSKMMEMSSLFVGVTYDAARGYVGTAAELRQPVIALSLGGLRRKAEALMLPEDVTVVLKLDKAARLERDRRRLTGRPRPGAGMLP